MKTPTQTLVDEVKNWSFDDWKIFRDDPKLLSNVLSSVQKAAPEVFENVLRTVLIPPAMNNPEVNSILGEWKMEKEPEDDNHFGEEQAEGLSNLLEGLRDAPHDNRW